MRKDFDFRFKKGGHTGVCLSVYEEYSQFFKSCNWYTYRPVFLEIDWDRTMGSLSVDVTLLGLGFSINLNYAETDDVKNLKQYLFTIEEFTIDLDKDVPK